MKWATLYNANLYKMSHVDYFKTEQYLNENP
jgi:hypothetical protein